STASPMAPSPRLGDPWADGPKRPTCGRSEGSRFLCQIRACRPGLPRSAASCRRRSWGAHRCWTEPRLWWCLGPGLG
ncbi:unnamed protein product, partial [Effrenium voratum]